MEKDCKPKTWMFLFRRVGKKIHLLYDNNTPVHGYTTKNCRNNFVDDFTRSGMYTYYTVYEVRSRKDVAKLIILYGLVEKVPK